MFFWCCKELGIDWWTARYVLLGDDVAIGDDRLAKKYREVMAVLGVEVSVAKTWKSPLFLEFAKRYFYAGHEVTPFSTSAVCDWEEDVALLAAALAGEERKGLKALSGIPGAVGSFMRTVRRIPKESVVRSASLAAERSLRMSSFLQGRATATETVVSVCGLDSAVAES